MEATNEYQYFASEGDHLEHMEIEFITDFFEPHQALAENENKYAPNHSYELEEAFNENGNYYDMDTPNGNYNVSYDSPEFRQLYGIRENGNYHDMDTPNGNHNYLSYDSHEFKQPYGIRENGNYHGMETPNGYHNMSYDSTEFQQPYGMRENGNYHDMETPNGNHNMSYDSTEFQQPYGIREFQGIEYSNDMSYQPNYEEREFEGIEYPNEDDCEIQMNSDSEETIDQDEYWINDIIVYSPLPPSDTNDENLLYDEPTPQNINSNNNSNSHSNTLCGEQQVEYNEDINIDTSNSEFSNLNITLCNVPQSMRNLRVRIHPVDINNTWLSSIYRRYENDLWMKIQRDFTNRHKRWIWKCLLCNKSLMKFETLKYHLNVHLGLYPFACKVCGKCYTSRTQATAHLRFLHQVFSTYEHYLGN